MDDLCCRRCYGRGIGAVTGGAGAITELRGAIQGVWALLRGTVRVWCGRCYGRDMGAFAGEGISAPSHYSTHHFTGGRDNHIRNLKNFELSTMQNPT